MVTQLWQSTNGGKTHFLQMVVKQCHKIDIHTYICIKDELQRFIKRYTASYDCIENKFLSMDVCICVLLTKNADDTAPTE